ncbi:MAG: hypothetical protein JXM72_00510 [Deltaproteobacteria bacterium]|nr:hypothetical protein [Deltaproteobacteria bacterium]
MIDLPDKDYFVGDIARQSVLMPFADKVISEHWNIDFLTDNACLSVGGHENWSYDDCVRGSLSRLC